MALRNGFSTEAHPKKVLLFGRTGCGKSTVANALVTGGIEEVVFPSDDSVFGCTTKIQEGTGRGWTVVDTVGLGEAEGGSVSNTKAKEMLTTFLKSVMKEYSHIIYVIKAGRITIIDELIWTIFCTIFEGGEEAFVVLFTKADDEWLDEQGDAMPTYLQKYPILATNIPPINRGFQGSKNLKIRRASIPKLEADLEKLFQAREHKYAIPKIVKMDDREIEKKSTSIIQTILDFLKRLFPNSKEKAKTALKTISSFIDLAGFITGVISLAQ